MRSALNGQSVETQAARQHLPIHEREAFPFRNSLAMNVANFRGYQSRPISVDGGHAPGHGGADGP